MTSYSFYLLTRVCNQDGILRNLLSCSKREKKNSNEKDQPLCMSVTCTHQEKKPKLYFIY